MEKPTKSIMQIDEYSTFLIMWSDYAVYSEAKQFCSRHSETEKGKYYLEIDGRYDRRDVIAYLKEWAYNNA